MRDNRTYRSARGGLAGLCALALAAGLAIPSASAQDASATAAASIKPQKPARSAKKRKPAAPREAAQKAPDQYFVEFRARHALSYGHTFLAHGRLNAQGEIVQSEIAGLHPFTESSVPWTIGHLVPVPSETGSSDGDLEEQYISARYRVLLSEAEYRKTVAKIRELQASSPLWHAVLYNCNAWVGSVARSMGLKAPALPWVYPEVYINTLRELNSDGQGSTLMASMPAGSEAASGAVLRPVSAEAAALPAPSRAVPGHPADLYDQAK